MVSEVTRLKNIARAKAWRLANPERDAENRRKWREKNPEKLAASRKRYAERHPEKMEEKWRRHNERFPEKVAARQAKYRAKNPERARQSQREFFAKEEGRLARRAGEARRRALKKGVEASATRKEIAALLAASSHCHYCGAAFGPELKATLDHVVPLARGGPHTMDNLVAACGPCNFSKGAKLIAEAA